MKITVKSSPVWCISILYNMYKENIILYKEKNHINYVKYFYVYISIY